MQVKKAEAQRMGLRQDGGAKKLLLGKYQFERFLRGHIAEQQARRQNECIRLALPQHGKEDPAQRAPEPLGFKN